MSEEEREVQMEMGVQPLDKIMTDLKLTNAQLVEKSTEQLTHKNVQKGRKGRRLSLNIRMKIINALNNYSPEKKYVRTDLFNY